MFQDLCSLVFAKSGVVRSEVPHAQVEDTWGGRPWWLLLLLAALVLRLVGLEARGLWLDEAVSIRVASRSLLDIASGSGFDKHTPPFYYLLLHLWLYLLPATELGIRLLSVLTDVVNVALIYHTFGRQYSRRVGLISAALYTCAPFSIYFAQEGRMYPLLVLLALVTYAFALRVVGAIPARGPAGNRLRREARKKVTYVRSDAKPLSAGVSVDTSRFRGERPPRRGDFIAGRSRMGVLHQPPRWSYSFQFSEVSQSPEGA